MPDRLLPRKFPVEVISSLIGLTLFIAALFWLHHALGEFHYRQVLQHLQSISSRQILFALLLTALSYLVLTAYDHLAIAYVQHPLPRGRITLASFISYAFSNTVGLSLLTGGSLRYRFYSAWGLATEEVARVLAFTTGTFWLGLFTLGGVLLVAPPTGSALPGGSVPLFVPSDRCHPSDPGRLLSSCRLPVPPPFPAEIVGIHPPRRCAWPVRQLLIGPLDWALAGSTLYVLLPPAAHLSLGEFLALYLVAQTAALISHVPGGLGVFETLIVLFLPDIPAPQLLGSLLIFRGIYYLLPLGAATVLLAGIEIIERRTALRRIGTLAGRWTSVLAPPVLSAATLVAGAILLFSGATPAVPERLRWLREIVPLPLLEVSHFLGSLTGAALLLLARGLQRRLDGAFHLTVGLLVAGIFFSLLKGADYEEAAILTLVLIALLPAGPQFYRQASLREERFTAGWVAAIAIVLLASAWLGIFAYKHVDYTGELWWSFTLHGNAPRFLRAEVGAAAFLLLFGLARLLRPSRPRPALPGPEELARASRIVEASPRTEANLALLGDKALLFGTTGAAFLMYGIAGRSWVAMGDPIGSAAEGRELAWSFRELAERHGGWAVFYEVGPEHLPLYLDLGLTLLKIGETASIPLDRFALEGGAHKSLRQGFHRLEREGFQFGIAAAGEVATLLPELKRISDAWLREKNTREKGFSLGFFQPEYLRRSPVACIRHEGRIVAFANLWLGAGREELSVDLMRFLPEASQGIMDFLLIHLLLWGKEEGFRRFNLGMAPLGRTGGPPARPALGPARCPDLPAWGAFLQLPGAARIQGKVRPRLAAALSGPSRRDRPAPGSGQHRHPGFRRGRGDFRQMRRGGRRFRPRPWRLSELSRLLCYFKSAILYRPYKEIGAPAETREFGCFAGCIPQTEHKGESETSYEPLRLTRLQPRARAPFSTDGGEMGERIRTLDWSQTPLGPIEGWPQSLKTAVGIMLGAHSPVAVFWGADLILLYNDPYRNMIGKKHPRALGRPAREVYPEIWDELAPMFDRVISGQGATAAQDQLLPIDRNGRIEDAWFDFSLNPIPCEDGSIRRHLQFCTGDHQKSSCRKGAPRERGALPPPVHLHDGGFRPGRTHS